MAVSAGQYPSRLRGKPLGHHLVKNAFPPVEKMDMLLPGELVQFVVQFTGAYARGGQKMVNGKDGLRRLCYGGVCGPGREEFFGASIMAEGKVHGNGNLIARFHFFPARSFR